VYFLPGETGDEPASREEGQAVVVVFGGHAAAAHVRLIVWCKGCRHQTEPDPAEMAARYGAETSVLE